MHIRRRSLLVIMLLILLSGIEGGAWASSVDSQASQDSPLYESIQAQLRELELEEIVRYIDLVEPDYQDFLPSLELKDIVSGGISAQGLTDLLRVIFRTFLREIYLSSYLLRQLAVIAILSALLTRLGNSFGEKTIVELAYGVCFLVIMFIGLQSFRTVLNTATQTIEEMVSFMYALLPLMSALLAAVGGVTSAAIFHPILIAVVGSIAWLVRYLLFPIIFGGAVLGLLSHFAIDFPLSRLAGFVRQISVTILSAFFIIFSGVMAVRGAISPVADGIGLRAAKFLTKTFVPVVGGMFADAVEVVAGGSLLIKNAVGVFGLAVIFFLVAVPIMKVWAVVLVYKLVGALIQPIVDARIVDAISSLESSLTMVLVALATVALMFFLAITVLIGVGNIAAVMR